MHRVKTTASSSRTSSPLVGVAFRPTPTHSPHPAPGSTSPVKPTPSNSRDRSASPPRFERAPLPTPDSSEPVAGPSSMSEPAPSRADDSDDLNPRNVDLHTLAEFGVPPLPTGPCDPTVQAKLAQFYDLSRTRGLYFNDSLLASKAFRNPRIYAKLVDFVDVENESATCWDKEVWDPRGLGPNATAARIGERTLRIQLGALCCSRCALAEGDVDGCHCAFLRS